MTREEYRAAMADVIYLCSCALRGETPDAARVSGMDLARLYEAAERHQLSCISGYALEAAGLRDPAFVQAKAKAIRKNILLDAERAAVLRALDEAGIWYMPLKGSVLKELYPAVGMRQMADNDILFDASRAEDVRRIMEQQGFQTVEYDTGNHDSYSKEPVFEFEMHRALFDPVYNDSLFSYYQNIKDRLLKDEGKDCAYHFSAEDFYLYMIAHEYKHYSGSGTGLRSLLDTFVYWKHFESQLDEGYIAAEAEKLGMADFEKQNRSLALHLFKNEALSESEEKMLDYILFSGTYGTEGNRARNQIKKRGRFGYLFIRLFHPYKEMVKSYPILKKLPFLLPFFWPIRIVSALITKPKKVFLQLGAAFRPTEEE